MFVSGELTSTFSGLVFSRITRTLVARCVSSGVVPNAFLHWSQFYLVFTLWFNRCRISERIRYWPACVKGYTLSPQKYTKVTGHIASYEMKVLFYWSCVLYFRGIARRQIRIHRLAGFPPCWSVYQWSLQDLLEILIVFRITSQITGTKYCGIVFSTNS